MDGKWWWLGVVVVVVESMCFCGCVFVGVFL